MHTPIQQLLLLGLQVLLDLADFFLLLHEAFLSDEPQVLLDRIVFFYFLPFELENLTLADIMLSKLLLVRRYLFRLFSLSLANFGLSLLQVGVLLLQTFADVIESFCLFFESVFLTKSFLLLHGFHSFLDVRRVVNVLRECFDAVLHLLLALALDDTLVPSPEITSARHPLRTDVLQVDSGVVELIVVVGESLVDLLVLQ